MDKKALKPKIVLLNIREFRKLNRGDAVDLEAADRTGKPIQVRLDKESLKTVRAVARLFAKTGDDGEGGKAHCNICGRSFETKEAMRVHRFRAHRKPGIRK